MSILLTITIPLLITFAGGRLLAHFKYPPLIGQFIAALVLAIPLIKGAVFTDESFKAIEIFAELSMIFLLLLTGLKTDIDRINQSRKDSIVIAFLSSLIPLIIGLTAGLLMGFGFIASFILGTCLSITAEATNLAILLQLGKLRTKLGSIVISVGMLNDILGIIFLSFILILTYKNGISSLLLFPVRLGIFVGIIWAASKLIPPVLSYFESRKREVVMFNLVILVGLILAILSELAGLSSIVGAFIAGVILQNSFILKRDEKHEEHEIETILFGFIIPFFFINIALNFDFRSLTEDPVLILIIIIIAIFGKIAGALLAKPFTKLKWKQAYLLGWEMNSRGVIELIIANIALNANLISTRLYSAIVLMAILTTLISPFFIKNMINRYPRIMS
ncbi:cation:proton antiporter [Candidatus Peregrinibacteria bacterium]|nr:cation:proton antiporter [Candidatus Peregrinibacteria bacterium]